MEILDPLSTADRRLPVLRQRFQIASATECAAGARQHHCLQAFVITNSKRCIGNLFSHTDVECIPCFRAIEGHYGNFILNFIGDRFIAHKCSPIDLRAAEKRPRQGHPAT